MNGCDSGQGNEKEAKNKQLFLDIIPGQFLLIALMDDSLQEYGLLVRMYCMRGKPFHQRDIVSSQEPCFLGCQCHSSWNRRIE